MASTEPIRKKSPRAPSISLDEALDRALKVYDAQRLSPASADAVAHGMGYKDANNGRALAAIASLRYFGLLERQGDGRLAVSRDVEDYKFALSDDVRLGYLRRFVVKPALFAEVLETFGSEQPSGSVLRYELVQRGFLPATAENLLGILERSFNFARVYTQGGPRVAEPSGGLETTDADRVLPLETVPPVQRASGDLSRTAEYPAPSDAHDRIPVRLSGGRRAWLIIPPVFREADKQRLKAQIDLLLTEDDE